MHDSCPTIRINLALVLGAICIDQQPVGTRIRAATSAVRLVGSCRLRRNDLSHVRRLLLSIIVVVVVAVVFLFLHVLRLRMLRLSLRMPLVQSRHARSLCLYTRRNRSLARRRCSLARRHRSLTRRRCGVLPLHTGTLGAHSRLLLLLALGRRRRGGPEWCLRCPLGRRRGPLELPAPPPIHGRATMLRGSPLSLPLTLKKLGGSFVALLESLAEGRTAVHVARAPVGAGRQQRRHACLRRHRKVQGCAAVDVLLIHERASVHVAYAAQDELQRLHVAADGRAHEGAQAVLVGIAEQLGTVLEQRLRHANLAATARPQECRVSLHVALGGHAGAGVAEEPHHLHMSFPCRPEERRIPILVCWRRW